jgi:hypothetical protein
MAKMDATACHDRRSTGRYRRGPRLDPCNFSFDLSKVRDAARRRLDARYLLLGPL